MPEDTRLHAAPSTEATSEHPPYVCVGTNDEVWGRLLVRNLVARNISATCSNFKELKNQLSASPAPVWVVVDGAWPVEDLRSTISDITSHIDSSESRSVLVTDELLGRHPIGDFTPDSSIGRSADMRVLVRNLLSVIAAT